jgi:hypothetical protein
MPPETEITMTNNIRYLRPAGTTSDDLVSGGEPPHDGGMEARVAKLEAAVEHIQNDVAEIKAEMREMRNAWLSFKDDVNKEFTAVRNEMKNDLKWTIGTSVGIGIALFVALSKGFGWL